MAKSTFKTAAAALFGILFVGQTAAQIQFCTESSYAATESCPAWAPAAGAGVCYSLNITTPDCYTWDDFPDAPADLLDEITFISVNESLGGCNLYKTQDCTVTPDEEWDAVSYGNFDLTCRYHLAYNISSWLCGSSAAY